METIGGAHAANAISYVLDKEKARKENKPVFLAANKSICMLLPDDTHVKRGNQLFHLIVFLIDSPGLAVEVVQLSFVSFCFAIAYC